MSDDNGYGYYTMILEWDSEDRIYVVTVPELPGCMTHGATRAEAVSQGQYAIESWIDAAREWGSPIPQPKLFELDEPDISGVVSNIKKPQATQRNQYEQE